MGFNIKSWNDPIVLDSNNLNRIEQGIKNAHDTLEITNEEVSNIQNKQLEILQDLNNLTQNNPEILNTLNKISTILADNNNMEEILSNTETFLRKSEQTLTSEELTQVYKNLKLNTFLKLTSIKVNGEDVVSGSEVNIKVPKVDNALNIYSSNAISNKAVAKLLQDFKPSVTVPTTLAELLEDNDHQTVTAAEKAKWNSNTGSGSSGGIAIETDPTVPDWAKASHKPFYDYSEILNTPDPITNNIDLINGAGYTTETRSTEIATTVFNTNIDIFETTKVSPFNNRISVIEGQLPALSELLNNHNHDTLYSKLNHTHQDLKDYIDNAISTKANTSDLSSYLLKSGGQLTGRISFKDNNALPEADSLDFVLGIDSYATGGGIKYTTNNKLHVGSATTASSATKANYLTGFDSASTGQAWGNQVGTYVMGMRSAKANSADIGEIAFRQDNPKQGQLSMIIDGTVYVNEGNDEVYTKAGGTLNGALLFPSTATYSTTSQPTALSYGRLQAYGTLNINGNTDNSGTEYVNITAGHGCSNSTADGLSIGTDTLTWKDQPVIHSGNINSYMASNATYGYVMKRTTINASSLDVNTYYPVRLPLDATQNARIEIHVGLNSGTKPSWSTHSGGFTTHKIWESNGGGWGTSTIKRRIFCSAWGFADIDPVRGITQLGNDSSEFVYVRGGGKYFFFTSHNITPILYTSTYTGAGSQTISPTTGIPSEIVQNYGDMVCETLKINGTLII